MPFRTDKPVDLLWSPVRDDEFIAYGRDLYLFKVKNNSSVISKENAVQLCEETGAELIGHFGDSANNLNLNLNLKLVAWYTGLDNPNAYAIVLPNSKIQLISFLHNNSKRISSTGNKFFEIQKEFSFKQARQCTNLVWNPHQKNILAAGFEKIRNEHTILVWDVCGNTTPSNQPVNKFTTQTSNGSGGGAGSESTIYCLNLTNGNELLPPNNGVTSRHASLFAVPTGLMSTINAPIFHTSSSNAMIGNEPSRLASGNKPDLIRSVYETGTSETCNSLAWHPHNQNLMLAGVNGKTLKIFDIRGNTKAVQSVNTKYVLGFSIDPSPNGHQYQAASYYENSAVIWDTRMLDKPVYQINEPDVIVKMAWCPAKSEKLAILSRNSTAISVYSVKLISSAASSNMGDDENAPIQVSVEKISRKFSQLTMSRNEPPEGIMPRSSSTLQTSSSHAPSILTNFTWHNFDSNKILIANNNQLQNMSNLTLSDTFAINWSPNGDFCWSSSFGRINMIEGIDKGEMEFMNQLKRRTKSDYGLKYEIITMSNGSATLTSSTASTVAASLASSGAVGGGSSYASANSSSGTPLALTLYAHNGLQTLIRCDFQYNARICDVFGDEQASLNTMYLWQWFHTINYIFEKIIPLNPRNNTFEVPSMNCRTTLTELYSVRYCGLKILLNELIEKKLESHELRSAYEERFRVLAYNLCEWIIKDGTISPQFFSNLEASNQFERACCLALLTKNHEQALEILDAAYKNDTRYGSLWIALKYFCEEQQHANKSLSSSMSSSYKSPSSPHNQSMSTMLSSPYRQNSLNVSFDGSGAGGGGGGGKCPSSSLHFHHHSTFSEPILKQCNELIENFNSPYLRALFNFLINREDSLAKILYDKDLLFQDRIALSIYFMFDQGKLSQLATYFENLFEEECLKNADMHGILLTGLSPRCLDLFQTFIDRTGDIQTVSLAIIHSPYTDVLEAKQTRYWINSYREQLNRLKFWEKRAEFDLLKVKLFRSQSTVISPQSSSSTHQHHHETTLQLTGETTTTTTTNNLSSSSSSSLTSNSNLQANTNTNNNSNNNTNNTTPTHRSSTVLGMSGSTSSMSHQQLPRMNSSQGLRQYQRNLSVSAQMVNNSSSTQPMPVVGSSSHHLSHQQQHYRSHNMTHQQTPSIINTPSHVFLVCNACGKCLNDRSMPTTTTERLNGSSSSHQLATTTATFNLSSSLTGSTNATLPVPASSSANKEAVNIANESNLIGCLNCAQFLPQCTICLRIMKINLLPVPQHSYSGTHQILPKSQSIYFQSPKMSLPSAGGFGPNKKLSSIQQFKSPSHQVTSSHHTHDDSQHSFEQQQQLQQPSSGTLMLGPLGGGGAVTAIGSQKEENKRRVYELSAEALTLLANTKIGNWFSWCQTCKHGGHIKHLIEWFRYNQKCPYLHCECQCVSIDFVY